MKSISLISIAVHTPVSDYAVENYISSGFLRKHRGLEPLRLQEISLTHAKYGDIAGCLRTGHYI